MTQQFQFSVRWLLLETTLIAVVLASLLSIGEGSGPVWSGCLMEIAVTTLGAALGMLWGKPIECAAPFCAFGTPLACFVGLMVLGMNI